MAPKATGSAKGWWGLTESAEAFLDQLVTWRELGFNMARRVDGFDRYEALPDWAKRTLADHEGDPREHVYTADAFESARTHDPLWNAAQRQLVREGTIASYLRMVWGKKVLDWSRSPREAAETLVYLNDKYATDGRDPRQLFRRLLVLRSLRPAVGPGAPGLREGTVHDHRQHPPQAALRPVHRAIRGVTGQVSTDGS